MGNLIIVRIENNTNTHIPTINMRKPSLDCLSIIVFFTEMDNFNKPENVYTNVGIKKIHMKQVLKNKGKRSPYG